MAQPPSADASATPSEERRKNTRSDAVAQHRVHEDRLAKALTFLLKTLIVVLLSALLVPAFTRQWDDRQKARELKASMVSDIAAATAGALTAGYDSLFTKKLDYPGPDLGPVTPAESAWSTASIQIDAKLRAYFSQQIVEDWRYYSVIVENIFLALVGPSYDRGSLPLPTRGTRLAGLDAANGSLMRAMVARARYVHDRHRRGHPEDVTNHYIRFERQILRLEAEVADEVLAAHPSGYSTSAHDLFRDLTP
jgi:hypothetical protein